MKNESSLSKSDLTVILHHLAINGITNTTLAGSEPIKKLKGGLSRNTYLIKTTSGNFVVSIFRNYPLRFFKANSPSLSHNFQHFLIKKNMPVPKLIGGLGKLRNSVFQLQTLASGSSIPPDKKHMEFLGESLSRLHIITSDFPLSLKEKILGRLHVLSRLFADQIFPGRQGRIAFLIFIKSLWQTCCGKEKIFPCGMIHGGIRLPNLLFYENGVTFLDFEGSHYAAYWRDIARPLGTLCFSSTSDNKYKFNSEKAASFLLAYHKNRPLTAWEIALLPGKALLFAERNILHEAAGAALAMQEKLAVMKAVEEGMNKMDLFQLLNVKKPASLPSLHISMARKTFSLRSFLTATFAQTMNHIGITTLRQLKEESLEWSNKFNHPITWDTYMKGGNGGWNRRGRDDARDAFRHAYAGAVSTFEAGSFLSALIGDARKLFSLKRKAEKKMDMHNNRVGREIGKKIRKIYAAEKIDDNTRRKAKDEIAHLANKSLLEGRLMILNNDTTGPAAI